MIRRLLILLCGTLAFWVVTVLPFRALSEDSARGYAAVAYGGLAALLCLVPSVGTLLWSYWGLKQSPEHQLAAVLGGTGLRMAFVLAAGIGLYRNVPYLREYPGFWPWVLVMYLFTLALEMGVLLIGRSAPGVPVETAPRTNNQAWTE